MPFPDALKGNPKCIFFTDFDGTITLQDSNDYMTDNLGFGEARRKQLNADCLDGRATFREIFTEMLASISTPLPGCIDTLLAHITLDPHFTAFFHWATAHDVPVIVLSSGMRPIIRALLSKLVGDEASTIEIICNEAVPRPGKTVDQPNGWTIQFHDDSGFGHDKSLAIRPYREAVQKMGEGRPVLLYAGDGVSDLSAASETDLLFAKRGRDLVTYCEREGVPFTVFGDWSEILETTKRIYEGKTSIGEVATEGAEEVKENGEAVNGKETTK
ncbi:hypothetical protein MMC18_004206 [Xylographa bjoerkii]|nr:hypothetical protein [Xylographa bjoerkii]